MENPKWWHVAVAVITVVLAVMLFFIENLSATRVVGALLALAVFATAWYSFGRLAWQRPGAAVTFVVVMILSAGTATAFYPAMAIIQCVAFPLIWVIFQRMRDAIIGNVALALAVGAGLAISFGLTVESALQAAFTAALSLGFSIALGLWITRITDLSAERQELLDDLQAAQGQLSALHRDAGIASERERLARELHDTIAQSLTGLVMLSQGAQRSLRDGNVDDAAATLTMIEANSRDTLAETRALVASGASVEVPGGIVAALGRLAERFERETGITVTVDADRAPRVARDTEVVLLRCTQEALANVRKHADASSVAVTVAPAPGGADPGGVVTLTVHDNGVGFAPEPSGSGFGLAGMRERLALVNGSLEVSSGKGATTLNVRVPSGVPA